MTPDQLLAEVQRLQNELAHREAAALRLIDERDRLETLLDRFAYAIAPMSEIGEHSSGNDPWKNALEIITPVAEHDSGTEVSQ